MRQTAECFPIAGTIPSLVQIDPANLPHLIYGDSNYDIRNYFQVTYSWTQGWKFTNGLLSSTIGGWTLGETLYFRCGPWVRRFFG